jgi:hypothetical protein
MRRIVRRFALTEISGVDRPAQRLARVAIMKRDDSDGFNAHGSGPMHDKLFALFDNEVRGFPNRSREENFASVWRQLSLSDRNQIRDEESGAYQEWQAEEARLRAAAHRGVDMSKVDTGALAMIALEGAAEALRKRERHLSKEQAFACVYTDPANRIAQKAERESARAQIAGESPTPRREMVAAESIAKRDHALGELRGLADDLRKRDPGLSPEQAFARVYRAHPTLAARERAAAREAIFAV